MQLTVYRTPITSTPVPGADHPPSGAAADFSGKVMPCGRLKVPRVTTDNYVVDRMRRHVGLEGDAQSVFNLRHKQRHRKNHNRAKGEKSGMKVYASALTLLHWLAQRESASVSEITTAGLMGSRTASDVIRYAIRNGAITRVSGTAAPRGSARYRSTGVPLPEPRSSTFAASFDGLLRAWGIAEDPPQLAVLQTRVYQISDSKQEV